MDELPCLTSGIESIYKKYSIDLSIIEGNLYTSGIDTKKILYITSCYPKEGKTISSIGISLGLSWNGKKVLLVDSNSSNPSIHVLFQTTKKPGLVNLYYENIDIGSITRETAYKNLYIITHGELEQGDNSTINNIDIIKKSNIIELFDYIVIDGQSIMTSSFVPLMAKKIDGLILVVECERTKRQVIKQAKEKIEQSNGKILGVVLNKRKYYLPKFIYDRI